METLQLCRAEQELELFPWWERLVVPCSRCRGFAQCLGSVLGMLQEQLVTHGTVSLSCFTVRSAGLVEMVVAHPFGGQPAPSSARNPWQVSGIKLHLELLTVYSLCCGKGQLSAELNVYPLKQGTL